MKKSKFAIVIALGLVLCLLCGVTTTFSWFSREYPSKEGEMGDTFKWSGQYKISSGANIKYRTVESPDDGATFGENEVTNFSGTIAAGARKYYCTEISNSSKTAEQSVSLFIDQLKFNNTSDSLYIGVNSPLKTYKEYSGASSTVGTATTVQNNTMRVYFQHKQVSVWDSGNISVYYSNSSTLDENSSHIDVSYIGNVGNPQAHTYYVDLPSDTQKIFFKVINNSGSFYRTQNQDVTSHGLSTTQSLVYYLTGNGTGSPYYNAEVKYSQVTGANIATSYGSIIVPMNGTFTASLTSGTDYTGTMKYYTEANSCFSVDENTGVITPKSVGSSKLYMKVTGTFGDSYQLECSVTVKSAQEINQENVPIVTNLEIGKATDDGDTVSKVYWYIKNESSSAVSYTLDGVYVSL